LVVAAADVVSGSVQRKGALFGSHLRVSIRARLGLALFLVGGSVEILGDRPALILPPALVRGPFLVRHRLILRRTATA